MQTRINKNVIEKSALQATQKRPRAGTIVSVNSTDHTMTLDVGHTDTDGNVVYMVGISYDPASPPRVGDKANLNYADLSPYMPTVSGTAVGGQNSTGAVSGVLSIAADAGTAITGAVGVVSSNSVKWAESGQNLTPSIPFWKQGL